MAVGVLAVLIPLPGCDDVQVNWGEPQRRGRPAPIPLAAPASTAPSTIVEHVPVQPPEAPRAYQVVLFSGPAPSEAPPGMRHVRLKAVAADSAGLVLSALCLPSGSIGTARRYTLIYPTPIECDVAARWAERVDLAPVASAGDSGVTLNAVLAQWYGRDQDPGKRLEQTRAGVDAFLSVLNDPRQPAADRWIAGMVGARLLVERLCEYARAEQVLRTVDTVAAPGSYEQMATLYARGLAMVQDGRFEEGRQLLMQLISQFGAFRETEICGRARCTLSAGERGR